MNTFLKVIYVILTAFLTAIITMNLKAMLFDYENGWDGIAAILGGMIAGLLLGTIGGIYSLKWIKKEKLKPSILIVLGLSLLMSLIVYLQAESRQTDSRQVKSMRLERLDPVPENIGVFKLEIE